MIIRAQKSETLRPRVNLENILIYSLNRIKNKLGILKIFSSKWNEKLGSKIRVGKPSKVA